MRCPVGSVGDSGCLLRALAQPLEANRVPQMRSHCVQCATDTDTAAYNSIVSPDWQALPAESPVDVKGAEPA